MLKTTVRVQVVVESLDKDGNAVFRDAMYFDMDQWEALDKDDLNTMAKQRVMDYQAQQAHVATRKPDPAEEDIPPVKGK